MILDESTNVLDSEVELDIQRAIDAMLRERKITISVIAHRLSIISRADKIVVVAEGCVVQEGTHDELIASKEWYAVMASFQASGEIISWERKTASLR